MKLSGATTLPPEQAFHHYDARGHCTLLTDSSANILEQYEYDAFGQPYFYDASGNSIGSSDLFNQWQGYSQFGNRFLFTGREWLADVRLYDYRNRMYQPELGRFMQPDPIGFGGESVKDVALALGSPKGVILPLDYNLYRYCHNDPVNKADPTGLDYILLNDWDGAYGVGHSAALVGNDHDGWMYYSKNGAIGSTAAPFTTLKQFQQDGLSTRYKRGLRIATESEEDKAMKDYGNRNYNKKYDAEKENCADLTADIANRGNLDVGKPKVSGIPIFAGGATDSNKQYDQTKEKYKDVAAPIIPHIRPGSN